MPIKLSFLGAAQNVTGSRFLVEANGSRLLIDCGLYQERDYKSRNWDPFPVPPGIIDSILLTHAHIDHSGFIPKLAHDGFRGKIHCTPSTSDIAEIMLLDAAKLQTEDAEYKRKRHEREGRKGPYPEIPLYTTEDVEACLPTGVLAMAAINTGKRSRPAGFQNGSSSSARGHRQRGQSLFQRDCITRRAMEIGCS